MKNLLVKFAFVMLVAVMASGCVKKVYVKNIPATPTQPATTRPATPEEIAQDKVGEARAKTAKDQIKWKVNLGLRCLRKEDEDAVIIYPVAGDLGSLFGRSHLSVLVTNSHPYPVAINILQGMNYRVSTSSLYVSNLAYGCMINLVRRLNVFVGDPDYLNIVWEATSFDPNGSIFKDRSQSYYLNSHNTGGDGQTPSWIIDSRMVTPTNSQVSKSR